MYSIDTHNINNYGKNVNSPENYSTLFLLYLAHKDRAVTTIDQPTRYHN